MKSKRKYKWVHREAHFEHLNLTAKWGRSLFDWWVAYLGMAGRNDYTNPPSSDGDKTGTPPKTRYGWEDGTTSPSIKEI